jgi:hypothetical protein
MKLFNFKLTSNQELLKLTIEGFLEENSESQAASVDLV